MRGVRVAQRGPCPRQAAGGRRDPQIEGEFGGRIPAPDRHLVVPVHVRTGRLEQRRPLLTIAAVASPSGSSAPAPVSSRPQCGTRGSRRPRQSRTRPTPEAARWTGLGGCRPAEVELAPVSVRAVVMRPRYMYRSITYDV